MYFYQWDVEEVEEDSCRTMGIAERDSALFVVCTWEWKRLARWWRSGLLSFSCFRGGWMVFGIGLEEEVSVAPVSLGGDVGPGWVLIDPWL